MIWTIVIALFIWQGASALIDLLFMLIEESANKPAKVKVKRESEPLPLYDIMWGVIIVVLMIVIIAIKHF